MRTRACTQTWNMHIRSEEEMVEFLTLFFMPLSFLPRNKSTISLCYHIWFCFRILYSLFQISKTRQLICGKKKEQPLPKLKYELQVMWLCYLLVVLKSKHEHIIINPKLESTTMQKYAQEDVAVSTRELEHANQLSPTHENCHAALLLVKWTVKLFHKEKRTGGSKHEIHYSYSLNQCE